LNSYEKIEIGGIEMNKRIAVKKSSNSYESAIGAVEAKKIIVCRLDNWDLVFFKMDKNEEKITVVNFDHLHMFCVKQKISKRAFWASYNGLYKPVVSDCYEVVNGGEVESLDDCERIMASLPLPVKKADHEKVEKFIDAKMLEHIQTMKFRKYKK
jgi:hypothetical protein